MSITRHETNPFKEGMMVPVRDKKSRASRLGKDDDVIVNQSTGEIRGTMLYTSRAVDSEKFVKLFVSNVCLAFDLSAAGHKAFWVLLWAVQGSSIDKDEVDMDNLTREAFIKQHDGGAKPLRLSPATFRRGLAELEDAKILAKSMRQGRYFINPGFIFNGDRLKIVQDYHCK